MVAICAAAAIAYSPANTLLKISSKLHSSISPPQFCLRAQRFPLFQSFNSFPRFLQQGSSPTSSPFRFSISTSTNSNGVSDTEETIDLLLLSETERQGPARVILWALIWTSISLALFAASGPARAAAVDSIRASSSGLRIASKLRNSGWPDQAIVFALATLPVLELRGAIPVGYWMQLKPVTLTLLSVLGNMVPVPFIVLYLKRFASFLTRKNPSASRFLDLLFERAREKAGPVEEFQWIGLMLFVAVPFPGTGAWTGAIIASILDMPFWSAVSANFCGVVLAGLLVNLLVNLGLKYAVATGIVLFFISTFMWSFLRSVKRSLGSSN
ncbi:uncharacterized protein LOC122075924 [Macadamia integrifolia]|uniref:uncharacterized protein LOC122075924 n=1 Tax=Macadamia integrifolia TaxID=60698 RepID=UPI001C4E692A|nr:uncharacterized protein LOC122075924 [Macadamia integrifolia]